MAERTVFQSISQRHVVSLGPQASVWEAACVMTRANCGSVLILDTPDRVLKDENVIRIYLGKRNLA